jgi:glycosyltransferase involved in cell wall biosynthesis
VGNISNWRWLIFRRRWQYKVAAWQCGYEFNRGKVKDLILKLFIPRFDYHLAYHTNAKKYALKYGAQEKAITVIHNTIDESSIDLLPKPQARLLIEAKYPVLRNKKILLYVGAILREKRLPIILESLELLCRENVAALFVGDGPYMSAFRKRCSGRSDVVLAGSIIDGIGPYFDAADCFILPGTGGLAINEAMAHALPVISGYADGSADDLIVDGENGFRLRTGDSSELAEKIQAIIDDDALAVRMGAISQQKIVGFFSFSNFIERVCQGLKAALLEKND